MIAKTLKAKLGDGDRDQEMLDKISKIEEGILLEQLTIAIKNKKGITGLLKGVSKDVFLSVVKDNRLLNMSARHKNYEAVRDILSMAKGDGILTEFEENINNLANHIAFMKGKSSSNALNAIKESCGLEDFLGIIGKFRCESVIRRLNKDASCKAMKVGSVCGVIAALAVGGGCFAAGAVLPMLAIVGIAVAAAVVAGFAAGCIAYAVLKPSNELRKINVQKKQETELRDMSNQENCYSRPA